MKLSLENTKYDVQFTSKFKKNFKKVIKQGKSVDKLLLLLFDIGSHSDLFNK